MAVTGVNQLLKYTETSKVAMPQKAMRTLLGNERSCDYVTTKVISKCCVLCMK